MKLDDFCSKGKDCKNILQTEALPLQNDLAFKSNTGVHTSAHILLKYKAERKLSTALFFLMSLVLNSLFCNKYYVLSVTIFPVSIFRTEKISFHAM